MIDRSINPVPPEWTPHLYGAPVISKPLRHCKQCKRVTKHWSSIKGHCCQGCGSTTPAHVEPLDSNWWVDFIHEADKFTRKIRFASRYGMGPYRLQRLQEEVSPMSDFYGAFRTRAFAFYKDNPEVGRISLDNCYIRFAQYVKDKYGKACPVGPSDVFTKNILDAIQQDIEDKAEAVREEKKAKEAEEQKQKADQLYRDNLRYKEIKDWANTNHPGNYTYESYKQWMELYHVSIKPYDYPTFRKILGSIIARWKSDAKKFEKLSEPGSYLKLGTTPPITVRKPVEYVPAEPYSDGDLGTVRNSELFSVLGIFYRTHRDNTWLEWLYNKFLNEVLKREKDDKAQRSNQAPSEGGYRGTSY